MKQGSTGRAPTLRLVIELAQIEITVETALEQGEPPRHDMEEPGSDRGAGQTPENHALDQQYEEFGMDGFERGIDPAPKPPAAPSRRLVHGGPTDTHRLVIETRPPRGQRQRRMEEGIVAKDLLPCRQKLLPLRCVASRHIRSTSGGGLFMRQDRVGR